MKPHRTYETGSLLGGKFRVLGVLGAGAMGTVYEVENERIEKLFALKVLHLDEQTSPETLKRFQTEIKAAGRIGNTHVVDVYDDGVLESGEPYVVMERLEGETLADLINRKGRLGLSEMCDLVGQACDGVQAAHDAGIIHRDLKPANLFVTTREGKPFVKLLDFGISKFERDHVDEMTRTHEGTVVGTPYYMSPEQIRGQVNLDAGVDVYALGVILYECAAGKVPYRATTLPMLGILVSEGKPEPLAVLRPDLPEWFRNCVARAMAADRARRTSTAKTLGETLRSLAGQTKTTSRSIDESAVQDWMRSTAIIEEPLDVAPLALEPSGGLSKHATVSGRPFLMGLMLAASVVGGATVAGVMMVLSNKPVVETTASSNDAGTNADAEVEPVPTTRKILLAPSASVSEVPSAKASSSLPSGTVPAQNRSQKNQLATPGDLTE